MTAQQDRQFLAAHCSAGTAPLVPEVTLWLARHPREIWQAAEEHVGEGPTAARPFWAFAWPGGQLLARLILDQPDVVRGRRVLDLGAGSGLAAIAAVQAGAASVCAVDPDRLAGVAMAENAAANAIAMDVVVSDAQKTSVDGFDVLLLADVAYEPALLESISHVLARALSHGATVLYADRASAALPALPPSWLWKELTTAGVPVVPELEEGQIESARVLTVV
jgi:predicted nicotinamide N-methyase